MKVQESNNIFNHNTASTYDNQRETLSPIKDALHLCIQMIFLKLPASARVLCVGVGTGAELIYLAQAFPHWQFTAVEPSSSMLDICRQHVEENGFLSRCNFHEGYLDSLPDVGLFDVATSILVSHFIVDPVQRGQYFSEISLRLHPGAYLVNVDLASDMSTAEYKSLLEVWINMHEYANMPAKVDSFGDKVAVSSVEKMESMIRTSGFSKPVHFFQAFLIHAWFSVAESGKYKPNKINQQ